MYEKILVPLDGSELAEAAVPYAEGVALRLKTELALVTACAPGDPMGQLYRGYLDKMAERLRKDGITVTVDCIEGEVAPAAADVFAVGWDSTRALILHNDGDSWSAMNSGTGSIAVSRATVIFPAEVLFCIALRKIPPATTASTIATVDLVTAPPGPRVTRAGA